MCAHMWRCFQSGAEILLQLIFSTIFSHDYKNCGKIKLWIKVIVRCPGYNRRFWCAKRKTNSTWEAAKRPNFAEMEKYFPFTTLKPSDIAVGLPWGKPGNSEVGHLTIGARERWSTYCLPKNIIIHKRRFVLPKRPPLFPKAIKHTKKVRRISLHLMGLYSTGTVHRLLYEHLRFPALTWPSKTNCRLICIFFTDGKGAYRKRGVGFYAELEENLVKNSPGICKIASNIGRGSAMDRNGDWEKTRKAYELFTEGKGNSFDSSSVYIKSQYAKDLDDGCRGGRRHINKKGKSQRQRCRHFFNFREDSARQIDSVFRGWLVPVFP